MTADHSSTIATAVSRLNVGDVDGYMDGLYTLESRFHGYPDVFAPDRDGIADFYRALVTAMPDTRISPEDMLVESDRVAVRFTFTGTHTGEFLGAAPTGRALEVGGITILKFEDGLVVERWNHLDDLGLLTQMGALATPVPG
jgi:predicted ester cyclase